MADLNAAFQDIFTSTKQVKSCCCSKKPAQFVSLMISPVVHHAVEDWDEDEDEDGGC